MQLQQESESGTLSMMRRRMKTTMRMMVRMMSKHCLLSEHAARMPLGSLWLGPPDHIRTSRKNDNSRGQMHLENADQLPS